MFLHIKSPLFEDQYSHAMVKVDSIEYLSLEKVKIDNKNYFKLLFASDSLKAIEIFSTEGEAKDRLCKVLIILGHTLNHAKAMANDFKPCDKTDDETLKEHMMDLLQKMKLEMSPAYES